MRILSINEVTWFVQSGCGIFYSLLIFNHQKHGRFSKIICSIKRSNFFMCLMISYFWQKDNFQNQHDWRKEVLTRKGKLSTNSCKRYKDDSLWYLFIFSSRAITMMIKFTYRNAKRTERFGARNVMKKFSADFNGSRSTLNIHLIKHIMMYNTNFVFHEYLKCSHSHDIINKHCFTL